MKLLKRLLAVRAAKIFLALMLSFIINVTIFNYLSKPKSIEVDYYDTPVLDGYDDSNDAR